MTEHQLRQKVADTINAWAGASKGSAKHLEILNIYNSYTPLARGYKVQVTDAYCATTVSAAYIRAGIAAYTGTECGVQEYVKAAQTRGIWVENDAHVPGLGDACVYDWDDSGKGDCTGYADHIGIVTSVGVGSFVVTEGNMSGGKVGKRTMAVNGRYIRGFICPDFAAIARKLSEPAECVLDIETLTDAQVLALASRMQALLGREAPAEWSQEARSWAESNGVIQGDQAGDKRYKAFVTREELAQVVYRMQR